MYDIFDFELNNKEVAVLVLVVFVFMVVVGGVGYMLGVRNAYDIHNNGGGAAGVGQQIGEAGSAVGNAAAGIEAAAGTAHQISGTITDAADTAGYIHSTARTSAELVAECQSIIRAVRSRGQKGTAAH